MTHEHVDKSKAQSSVYQGVKTDFYKDQGIISVRLEGQKEMLSFEEGVPKQENVLEAASNFSFIENPVNPKAAVLLEEPEFLSNHFEKEGFEVLKPRSVVNTNGSTLFISAGVQVLEPIYMDEKPIPDGSIYIAQPVFRTQYVGQAGEGYSSSFINVCLESVNSGAEGHFQNLQKVFTLFDYLGLDRKDFQFISDEQESVWGDRKHVQKRIKIFFQGLEIGDAILIEGFPQKKRKSLEISDIGLGLERLKWVLEGGSYWKDRLEVSQNNHSYNTKDSIKTLTLIAGSGVIPHYKAQGYRFRLLSKRLVEELTSGESRNGIIDFLSDSYNYWNNFTDMAVPKEVSLRRILNENTRNFNTELINRLKSTYESVDVDINKPTDQVVQLLKGTPADANRIQQIINEMGGPLI